MAAESDKSERDAVINRIRKILDKTNPDAGARQGEIEAALNMARKLMDKWNLSHADIATSPEKALNAFQSIVQVDAYDRAGGIDDFDRHLAIVADNICDVKHFRSRRTEDKNGNLFRDRKGAMQERTFLVFYGLPHDVEMAVQMYHELLATMRAMERYTLGPKWAKHHAEYCQGFVNRLIERSLEFKRSSVSEANTTAIVLVKDNMLKRYAEEKLNLRFTPGRSKDRSGSAAYGAGQKDANAIPLGRREKISSPSRHQLQ